jgi:hypothetical protein
VRLHEQHPELFERAVEYEEKVNYEARASGQRFTWSQNESLRELLARRDEIIAQHEQAMAREAKSRPNRPLVELLAGVLDEEDGETACTVCHV